MTLFIILIIVWFIEVFLAVTWNPYYYRYGVFVYTRTFRVPTGMSKFPSLKKLFEEPGFDAAINTIPVKALSENELALRESMYESSIPSLAALLHGYLVHKPDKRQLVLHFSLDWVVIVLFVGVMCMTVPGMLEVFQRDAILAGVMFPFAFGFASLLLFALAFQQVAVYTKIVEDLVDAAISYRKGKEVRPTH